MRKGTKMTLAQCKKISDGRKGIPAYNKGLLRSGMGEKFCEACGENFKCDTRIGDKRWRRQKFCSKSCALKGNMRTLGKNLGKNNAAWKGGICPVNAAIRSSFEMTQWRKHIFERDNYTCQKCFKRGGRLVAHHVKSFRNFPLLRFEITNGQTLCEDCHRETDNYSGRVLYEILS